MQDKFSTIFYLELKNTHTVTILIIANKLVSAPVLIVNRISLLMMFSLCLNPVRWRLSKKMSVAAMATSPMAARMLIDRERLTILVRLT